MTKAVLDFKRSLKEKSLTFSFSFSSYIFFLSCIFCLFTPFHFFLTFPSFFPQNTARPCSSLFQEAGKRGRKGEKKLSNFGGKSTFVEACGYPLVLLNVIDVLMWFCVEAKHNYNILICHNTSIIGMNSPKPIFFLT